jgi:integrase
MANGRYRARYRDRNGRSRSQTFDLKKDAQDFLDDASTDTRRGDFIDPQKRRESFDHWADRWWATTVKLRPTTRRGYWGVLDRHVRPYFTGMKLADVDYADVEDFIADRLGAGLSPKYVRQALSVLSLIFKLAVKSRVRRDNPAADHGLTVRSRKIREGDVLDMTQAQKLIEHVKDPYKPAVWLLLLTGMRPAELCGLKVGSVDFARHTVHVYDTLLPVHKYADEAYQAAVPGGPKTDAGDRSIPIPAWLANELAAMLAERAQRLGHTVMPADSPLFITPKGHPLHRDRFRQSVVRPALVAAGLPEKLRTYDLRHSHVSLLIDQGANVLAVAQRTGHTDPAMTLRVYGHLFEGVQKHLTRQLDELRAATAGQPTEADVVDLEAHREAL